MQPPIYLDNQATTPLDKRVLDAMMPYLTARFGNASSTEHRYGWEAESALNQAREQVAAAIDTDRPQHVIFTSGATESNNLAILGVGRAYARQGKHMVSVVTEHNAVLDPLQAWQREGGTVSLLPVTNDGLVDLDQLADAMTEETVLVSVMAVNNEIGVIQDIAAMAAIAHERGALFHSDAAQALGKIPVAVDQWDVDLLSLSGHKIYGPKGVGALYVRKDRRRRARLAPLLHGGGHEQGMRSGSYNMPGIVGMGKACALAASEQASDEQRIASMRDSLWQALATIDGVHLNGHPKRRIAGNLNLAVEGVDHGQLLQALAADIAISSGSACASANPEPSHVIRALSDENRAKQSIRIGIGRFNTPDHIQQAAESLQRTILKCRQAGRRYQ